MVLDEYLPGFCVRWISLPRSAAEIRYGLGGTVAKLKAAPDIPIGQQPDDWCHGDDQKPKDALLGVEFRPAKD